MNSNDEIFLDIAYQDDYFFFVPSRLFCDDMIGGDFVESQY